MSLGRECGPDRRAGPVPGALPVAAGSHAAGRRRSARRSAPSEPAVLRRRSARRSAPSEPAAPRRRGPLRPRRTRPAKRSSKRRHTGIKALQQDATRMNIR